MQTPPVTASQKALQQTLGQLSSTACARIMDFTGGRSMQQRLQMLGIRRGTEFCLVQGPSKRGAVVQVGGARIALGWGVIQQILVTELPR